ncbi:hypothetical protein [Methylobacterium soli]|uniref:CdiI immunity protein domain-containing protein n=1 Tax=Methylobacterium soli TaxID=553447 RepID=A0A6L3SW68_9HYPH|nr:hypothetical protein [Methylobacterium soli]KAB1077871.1 hypothetical protein F6X53_16800 [Methylobacterium soli]GJE42113.1 hypothetical protein AEGHOMDF_1284 [Methylobacterium soli]
MARSRKARNRAKRQLGRLPPTQEFLRFGQLFHQDLLEDHDGVEAATRFALTFFRGEERRRLRDFIGQILDSDLSPDELSKLWSLTGADWHFEPAGYRQVFGFVHDHLRKGLSRGPSAAGSR